MNTPSASRAKFGKELDGFEIEAVVEFVFLVLELALVVISGL